MPRNEFDFPFAPSTLETIDEAVHEYFNEKVNIHTTTNKGWEKVPMIWTSAERAYQIKSKSSLGSFNEVIMSFSFFHYNRLFSYHKKRKACFLKTYKCLNTYA